MSVSGKILMFAGALEFPLPIVFPFPAPLESKEIIPLLPSKGVPASLAFHQFPSRCYDPPRFVVFARPFRVWNSSGPSGLEPFGLGPVEQY